MTSDGTSVQFCPHCGNVSTQRAVYASHYTERLYLEPTGEESENSATVSVLLCLTCRNVLVYELVHDWEDYAPTPFGDLVYPTMENLDEAVPSNIRRTWDEAMKVRVASPASFVFLARRALEEICVDRGIDDRNLASALRNLGGSEQLPGGLIEACDVIRRVGNIGAHASEARIHALHAAAVERFLRGVLEHLYVGPARLREFKRTYLAYTEQLRQAGIRVSEDKQER